MKVILSTNENGTTLAQPNPPGVDYLTLILGNEFASQSIDCNGRVAALHEVSKTYREKQNES